MASRFLKATAVGIAMLMCIVEAAGSAGPSSAWTVDNPAATPPWLETWAPDAFTSSVSQGQVVGQATYRLDGEVIIPLGIGSIRIATVRDAGKASVHVRDYQSKEGQRVRAYEFVAYTIPERAHNQDRSGFMWEARSQTDRTGWSAYLGGMTRSPDRRSLQGELGQPTSQYEVIDGLISDGGATARVYRVPSGARRTVPADLYADIRPLLVPGSLRRTEKVDAVTPPPPFGFLGALDETLRTVHRSAPTSLLAQPFVYSGRVRSLDLLSVERDAAYGRTLAQNGSVKDPSAVHALRYRIMVNGEEVSGFTVWIERQSASSPNGVIRAVVPAAFEFRPRSFLRIRGVRTA